MGVKEIVQELETAAGSKIPTPPFEAHWINEPPVGEAIVLLDGARIASRENISTLSALPGAGKSQVCEAISAAGINKVSDNLGFEVNLSKDGIIYYVDTERSRRDFWVSWARALTRAQYARPEEPANVIWQNYLAFEKVDARKDHLQKMVEEHKVDLLIIDGIGDFILGVNDEARVAGLYDWLRALSVQHEFATLCTIHPNPGSEKMRGHLGSELMRRSEAVLTIKHEKESGIRTITSDFEFGKVRSDRGNISVSFQWDETARMMTSCDAPAPAAKAQQIDWKQVFAQDVELTTAQIKSRCASFYNMSEITTERRIKEGIDKVMIIREGHGKYKII